RVYPSLGGKLIDTAFVYVSEPLIGELVSELGNRDQLFIATKVAVGLGNIPPGRESGRGQIEQSFKRLRPEQNQLLSPHGVRDQETQLANINELKAAGRVRYSGITTNLSEQHVRLEQVIRALSFDFVQVNYALDDRHAAERVLPAAQDRGMAVVINVPFGKK